ncbi:MAG: polysaccharide biosynthesis/export family protein [Phycisphaerae bacterium]
MSRLLLLSHLTVLAMGAVGCNAIVNGWLDPSVVGDFTRSTTNEIRASLTLEDTPIGIPGAVYPSQADNELVMREYSISPGDALEIEINELRQRQVPYQVQTQVSTTGYVNIPVVGRVRAAGFTVPEFEDLLRDNLTSAGVLRDPEVTVNPLSLQEATYSIFGIGVSASTDAPLRAGTFAIRRPDLRVLEAINLVGGLNEFVTDVYVFRQDRPESVYRRMLFEAGALPRTDGAPPSPPEVGETGDAEHGAEIDLEQDNENLAARPPEQDLIDAVVAGDERTEKSQEPRDIPSDLEPEPTQPFLWVNDEFVPNPAYPKPEGGTRGSTPGAPVIDSAIPTVNWARVAGETTYRVIHIAADLLRSGDPEVNIYVRGGDVIRIVSGEIGVYYVMGQVLRSGAFAFNAEPVTIKAAIAAAGGLSPLAWPDRCTVYRRLGQREQMIQVDLDRIFAGKDPDFFIKRGDIINVGTHPFAPFLRRIREATLPDILSTVGYSYTYARNFADIDSFAVRRNPHNEPNRFENLFP